MSEFLDPARENLSDVQAVLSQLGLTYIDLDPMGIGLGVGVAWGETDFVVISISAGNSGWVYLTAGVVRDITQDRLPALSLCNEWSNNNRPCPVGWCNSTSRA